MKHLKHIIATVAALFVVLVVAAPAFAAEGHSITLDSNDTHNYNVYQILTGTLAEDGSKELGNPAWGANAKTQTDGKINGKTPQQFIDDIKNLTGKDLVDAVAEYVDTTGDPVAQVSQGHPAKGLATGYYVLVDKTTLTGDHKDDTLALNVIKVVNDIDKLAIKWDTTSDEKEIVTDTLGKDEGTNDINGDVDNVSVGDTVSYKITATIPENANTYNFFYFVVNDTLSKGLTLDADSITVYKNSISEETKLTEDTDYTLKTGNDASPKSFQVGIIDAKAMHGATIIVTYSATLNEEAEIEKPNTNTSTVTFSNDPNHEYDGTPTTPGFPDQIDETVFGETPTTTTETYTTGIEIQKVDSSGKKLTGATFEISGASTKIVLTVSESFTPDENGTYYKLKDGTYTQKAPTQDSMAAAEPGATDGYVVDPNGDLEVGGVKYRVVNQGETPTHVLVKGTADQYEQGKYKKVVGTKTPNTATDHKVSAAVDANGIVRFDGLGAGTYTIKETVTPEGFNTIGDLTLVVGFDGDNKVFTKDAGTTADATFDANEGIFKITVVNQKGTELPETGGMGTTVLYAAGAALVVCGGIYLVTKKRMGAAE